MSNETTTAPLYPMDDGLQAVDRMTAADAAELVNRIEDRIQSALGEPSWCERDHDKSGDARHYASVHLATGTTTDGRPIPIDVSLVAAPGEFARFEFNIGPVTFQMSLTDAALMASDLTDEYYHEVND